MSARSLPPETKRCSGSAGIMLIELLLAIAITGVLLVPLGASIYFGLRNTTDTQTQVGEATSANILASYFIPDVQGAEGAVLNQTEPSAACGSSTAPANLVLTTSATTSIAYVQSNGSGTSLYRRTCAGGTTTGTALVARSLAEPPVFLCDGANCSSVTVTLVQRDNAGRNEYRTRLEASKRASQ